MRRAVVWAASASRARLRVCSAWSCARKDWIVAGVVDDAEGAVRFWFQQETCQRRCSEGGGEKEMVIVDAKKYTS